MPLAEAITLRLIWPHGQVVLHQGDGRLQACQPVAAFSPGIPSTNCSRTTCPSIRKSPSYAPGCSYLVVTSWMLQAHGKADPLPSSGSGSGPQEERPIWSKMTLQTSGKLPQRPSEPLMTPAAAAMLPTLLQDITVLLERQCGFH